MIIGQKLTCKIIDGLPGKALERGTSEPANLDGDT